MSTIIVPVGIPQPGHMPGLMRDRRRYPRLKLVRPLAPSRPTQPPEAGASTKNPAGDGFYCISKHPFSPNEKLECELVMPGEKSRYRKAAKSVMRCRVEVVRLVANGLEPGFGLTCRLL